MHFGPNTILLAMDVEFDPESSAKEREGTVDRLEKASRDRHPKTKRIYLEAGAMSGPDAGG